jgi:hypothetical protein
MAAYRKLVGKLLGIALLAGMFGMVSTQSAEAFFVAAICNDVACLGGDDVIAVDDISGDLAVGAGVIATSGIVAGYEFTLSVSNSKPIIGSPTNPAMSMVYDATNITGGSADIWFYASDQDFVGITGLSGRFNATLGDSTSMAVYGSNSNTLVDISNVLDAVGPLAGAFDVPISIPLVGNLANPYSLTLGVRTRAATVAHGDLAIAPEPATLTLFGLGLLGAGAATRRRFRKQ